MKIDSASRPAPPPGHDCAPPARRLPGSAAAAAAAAAAGGLEGGLEGGPGAARSHVGAQARARPTPTRATGLRWTPGGSAGSDASSSAAAASLAAAAAATAAATAEPSATAAGAEGGGGGVEIDPTGSGASAAAPPDPGAGPRGGPPGAVVVRAEEALIVVLVLVLWVAAIALFFNRWGKIRMLEPYQPKYEAPHRGSCPLVDCGGAPALQHRSFSKFNLTACGAGGRDAGLCSNMPSPHNLLRPRQNSVFVGSSATMVTLPLNPPRKAKSAMDIQTLVLAECGPLPGGADGSFDTGGHVPDHLPDSNFSAAIAKIDTFKVTNV